MRTAINQESSRFAIEHDEKTDAELIAHVWGNAEATTTEQALADRLQAALYEIELLCPQGQVQH